MLFTDFSWFYELQRNLPEFNFFFISPLDLGLEFLYWFEFLDTKEPLVITALGVYGLYDINLDFFYWFDCLDMIEIFYTVFVVYGLDSFSS